MKTIITILFFMLISNLQAAQKIKEIVWDAPPDIKKYYKAYFNEMEGKDLDNVDLKLKIDSINKELFNLGFFESELRTDIIPIKNNEIALKIIVSAQRASHFTFSGNKIYSSLELKNKVYEKVKTEMGKIDPEQLKILITDFYEDFGFFNTKVEISRLDGKDKNNHQVSNYFVKILEGKKIVINKLEFRGAIGIAHEDLRNLFYSAGTNLIKENYFDKSFIEVFSNHIKRKYLTIGYVNAEVSKPRVISVAENLVDLEYVINEKSQMIINDFSLDGIPKVLENEIRPQLTNKTNSPINVIELENDFKKIINIIQSKGYFFASILNLSGNDLVKYDKLNSTVNITPNISLDRKACFNELILNGNIKTLSAVIERELNLKKNELITPGKVDSFKQKISSLGLFTSLKVTPYMIYEEHKDDDECAKTNLIVQIKEKDFGAGEFSLGYRTDLGAKAAVGISWNNLGGKNRSAYFKTQANRRFNLEGIDRNRLNHSNLIEHLTKISFVEPYLFYNVFKTQIETEVASSWQRKRFYSFDADILKVSTQFSKNFNSSISTSIKWQLEDIKQFGSVITQDNDNFTIGSFTPTFTYDHRDDPINPKKGYYLNLSSEWANHYFGSMKNSEFEVNYIKFVARNKFYFPIGNFIIATSLAGGFEKNYAELYYIPSIKVFRLDGFDEIRGFEDGEINRLSNGTKISTVSVTNSAYFMAFKLEPRYSISDNMQIGVFFDAGRVFVGHLNPFDLRTSVGAGFKFLTPVGSLDFDYGVKIKKLNYPDGGSDATGRFHLSIGFF